MTISHPPPGSETLSISVRPQTAPTAAKAAAKAAAGLGDFLGSLLGLNILDDTLGSIPTLNGQTLAEARSEREASAKAANEPFSLPGMKPSSTAPTQMSWGKLNVLGRGKGGNEPDAAGLTESNKSVDAPKTTDTRATLNSSSDFSGAFGDSNRDTPVVQKPPVAYRAAPIKTVVPTKPVNSTSSNGTPNDDLFELYRRMLGGFFRGSRV
ncbi:MAG: hypothetical protein HQ483_18330 [Rhodospirillales bacterium]|nr:hypothetical protein [Rhodospirillales bacterium]